MSIKIVLSFSLYCDGCGARYIDGGMEFTIFEDKTQMTDSALCSDWTTDGVLYHCPACPHLTACECCGQPANIDADDIGNICQTCWDSMPRPPYSCTLDHKGSGSRSSSGQYPQKHDGNNGPQSTCDDTKPVVVADDSFPPSQSSVSHGATLPSYIEAGDAND